MKFSPVSIAVCLTGEYASFPFERVYQSTHQNLVGSLNADLFATVPMSNKTINGILFNEMNALAVGVSDPEYGCSNNADEDFSLRKQEEECFNLIKKHEAVYGKQYDFIVKADSDHVWLKAVNLFALFGKASSIDVSRDESIVATSRQNADVTLGYYSQVCDAIDRHEPVSTFSEHLQANKLEMFNGYYPAIHHRLAKSQIDCRGYEGPRVFGPSVDDCVAFVYSTNAIVWNYARVSLPQGIPKKALVPSKIIHQTNKAPTTNPELLGYQNTWTDHNPGWTIKFYDDAQAAEFVKTEAAEYFKAYMQIKEPVVRADFFRYIVLYKSGGLYSDVDTECLAPLKQTAELTVGMEADFASYSDAIARTYSRQIQVLQWTLMARSAGHPIFKAACDSIKGFVERGVFQDFKNWYGHDRAVLEFSGPGLWTDMVLSYITRYGMKDVALLPQIRWGSLDQVASEGTEVLHHFRGSWKIRNLQSNGTISTPVPSPQPTAAPTPSPTRDTPFYCGEGYEASETEPFTCVLSDTDCDTDCAEQNCLFISSPRLPTRNRRRLSRDLQAGPDCPAGYTYDVAARVCKDVDECLGGACSFEGGFCVDYDAPFRFKCGCNLNMGYSSAFIPEGSSLIVHDDEVVPAIAETVMKESGEAQEYVVPAFFRVSECVKVDTVGPSTPTSSPVGTDTTEVDEEKACTGSTFGRTCSFGETCELVSIAGGDTIPVCLCIPGWEKIFNDPVTSLRGCQHIDKCNSDDWNDCSEGADCYDDFPGTSEPVRCVCTGPVGFDGGGEDCRQVCPPGFAVAAGNKCLAKRPGAAFSSSTNTCAFRECPFASGFVLTAGGVCERATSPDCDLACVAAACPGTFVPGDGSVLSQNICIIN